MNLSCVIYIRVSDQQQIRGGSLADQERACRQFAERAGLKVLKVYRDEGRSAYKDDLKHRPAFQQLLQAAGRQWSAVVVYKLDRFARRARIYHICRHQLVQAGVSLLSATEPNEESAAGRLSSGMLAEFAEFYSAQLSERLKGAAASKAARGLWVGPAPFGYELVDRQLRPGRLWLWVVIIFEAYRAGASSVELAAALNAAGVPLKSGRPWTKDSVLMVLRNHAYIGRAGGRSLPAYQAAHQHLVNLALWEEVQALLLSRRKRPQGPRRSPRPAPLPFIVICDLCGAPMGRATAASGIYLRCNGRRNKVCPARAVQLDLVLNQVQLLTRAGSVVAEVRVKAPRGVVDFRT